MEKRMPQKVHLPDIAVLAEHLHDRQRIMESTEVRAKIPRWDALPSGRQEEVKNNVREVYEAIRSQLGTDTVVWGN